MGQGKSVSLVILGGRRAVPVPIAADGFWVDGIDTAAITNEIVDQEPVTCVIPGHDRPGHELYGKVIEVSDDPLGFGFERKCAYWSTFSYSSEG